MYFDKFFLFKLELKFIIDLLLILFCKSKIISFNLYSLPEQILITPVVFVFNIVNIALQKSSIYKKYLR